MMPFIFSMPFFRFVYAVATLFRHAAMPRFRLLRQLLPSHDAFAFFAADAFSPLLIR